MTTLGVDALVVLGWREWVALPDLGIDALKVKVDTGARTSALHAFGVEKLPNARVRFRVHPHQYDDDDAVVSEAALVDERVVRTSGGHSELRPVVQTTIKVGQHEFGVELTLSNRALLGFRMLLGREAVRGRFLVDPMRSYCCGHKLRRVS
ncbi:ATP-dependent zinc protease family protein [Nannocystis pusilla]|uniref:RimK/LysX family protein n=1 Tax=Nannocystis pusilla TaxID=889268 RepID=A0ABS7TIE7_9BACT|nr:RimK/LysX family protein [Nannocystis pusilla]MBZ5708012.1 RimK/LysX family protein [Nannocystis pusilla]